VGSIAWLRCNGTDVIFGPNVLSIYGLADAGGYSSLVSARYHQLIAAGDPKLDIWWMDRNNNMVTFSHPSQRLLDLLQVAYVVSPLPLADPGIRAEWVADGVKATVGDRRRRSSHRDCGRSRTWRSIAWTCAFRVYRPGEAQAALAVRMWQQGQRPRLVMDTRLDIAQLQDQESVTLLLCARARRTGPRLYLGDRIGRRNRADRGRSVHVGRRCALRFDLGADWSQVFEGKVYIYERSAPYPRATVVYAAELIPNDQQAVRRLLMTRSTCATWRLWPNRWTFRRGRLAGGRPENHPLPEMAR